MEDKLTVFDALKVGAALDDRFAGVATPPQFVDITLYSHQAVVVRALLDLENERYVINESGNRIDSNALILSEPFGSGKTFEILAWIMIRPIPRAVPNYLNCVFTGCTVTTLRTFKHEILRKHVGNGALIRPTLIVVGKSVLSQWENNIRDHTTLKVFAIGNAHTLIKFYNIYCAGDIKTYDVILLKNGMVSANLPIPGVNPTGRDHLSLISVIHTLTGDRCWSRVIYDDYDTIGALADTPCINAIFTAFVSTTRNQPNKYKIVHKYDTIGEALSKSTPYLLNATIDDNLYKYFNVRCDPAFITASTCMPRIRMFRYVYNNPNDNYMRLLGVMGADDAHAVMEMLNGGAVETAADTLGIKSTSVADIFQRMLSNKYELFMKDTYILEAIANFRKSVDKLPEHPKNYHTIEELDAIRAAITRRGDVKCAYQSMSLIRMLDEMKAHYEESKNINGRAVNRVIDNMRAGECQICALPLEGSNIFIVKCCGIVVCDVCCFRGNQIQLRQRYGQPDDIYGSCANCKSAVYPNRDLILIDGSIDIESIMGARGDEKSGAPLPACEPAAEEKIIDPKLHALKSIIMTGTAKNAEDYDANIKHLIKGDRIVMPDPDNKRKILVFANFNETLSNIEKFLTEEGIPFGRLGGTFKEISATVKEFRESGQVLLINSQQMCAGLDLQFATDLVYFHKIMNKSIESQVCGRIQRCGRTSSASVHFLFYKNERALV